MPKNKGKGGKNRRRGKNENDNEKRELTFKEDGQEYAQVVKMLGYVELPFLTAFPVCAAAAKYSTPTCLLYTSLNARPRAFLKLRRRNLFCQQRITLDEKEMECNETLTWSFFSWRRNGRLEAQCFDGTRRLGNIRGKLRKKVWINQGDIILLSLRDYQDDKGDVMYVHNFLLH